MDVHTPEKHVEGCYPANSDSVKPQSLVATTQGVLRGPTGRKVGSETDPSSPSRYQARGEGKIFYLQLQLLKAY